MGCRFSFFQLIALERILKKIQTDFFCHFIFFDAVLDLDPWFFMYWYPVRYTNLGKIGNPVFFTKQVNMDSKYICTTILRRDERCSISPGTVSTTRRKFEHNDVESDKFARERSSTEKLRGILRAESGQDIARSGLASVSLLLQGSRQQQQQAGISADGVPGRNKVQKNFA